MDTRPRSVQDELRQRRPFRTRAQEAGVGLMLTADRLRRSIGAAIEPFGVTMQQYNVLRILRGAHPDPLPTLEIAERMIEHTPGVTRLLDRLEAKGLVRRERCTEDRRMVHCWITEAGLELLGRMDETVEAADERAVGALSAGEQAELVRLLDRVRAAIR